MGEIPHTAVIADVAFFELGAIPWANRGMAVTGGFANSRPKPGDWG
jgi:hypothetical protein